MMTKNQRTRDAANQDAANIRALSSITPHQADIIVQAVGEVAPIWAVPDLRRLYGCISILIQSAIERDNQKAFSIAGTAQCLELLENSRGRPHARLPASVTSITSWFD